MASPQVQPNQSPERRDFRREVTDSIIKMLEEGTAPWQKPWDPSRAGNLALPFNPTSGNDYRGGNAIHLMATAIRKNYDDPRWMTYRQAAENHWQVRKGEKGTQIEFWEARQSKAAADGVPAQATGNDPASKQGGKQTASRFIHRVYTVFNATQIDGVPAYEPKRHTPFEAIESGDRILRNSGAKLNHDQTDRAFYSRDSDSIHLPPREAFDGPPGYYGTALHELAHWTGHPDRLNRQTLNESHSFGDQNYAREELRAELASVFLAAERGIPHDPAQHASYVGSWIKALRSDKNEIFRAAQDASRVTDFLLALERDKAIGLNLVEMPESSASEFEEETARLQSDLESEPDISEPPEVITRETGDSIARLDPKDGVATIHDNDRGTDRALAVDPVASVTSNGSGSTKSLHEKQENSLKAAQTLASERLGKTVSLTAAVTEGGRYRGAVIGETDDFFIQQTGAKSVVAHSKQLLDQTPQVGQRVSIAYGDSHANVREIRERAKTHELAR